MSRDPVVEEEAALLESDLSPIDKFRQEHGTAVLVVLFTDLKGSTELAEQRGESYAQSVRQQHDEMLREIVERDAGGTCIKNIGDALMCIFAEPTTAVDRAVEIQEKLAEYNVAHPGDPDVKVRIGMHMGQVSVEGDTSIDVFGRHVNRAARVEGLADGGQILMTESVSDNAKGWLKERGLQWQDHGRYRLKGIPEPSRIFEVCLPSSQPQTPRGDRVRDRRWMIWAAALLIVAALVPVAWVLRPRQERLESRLDIRVLRNDVPMLSFNDALPLRSGDKLQVVGRLSRPAYASLIWVDTEGAVQVVSESGDRRVRQVVFPPGEDEWVTLVGVPGTEMCLLLTSEDEPLNGLDDIVAQLESTAPLSGMEKPGAIWMDAAKMDLVAAAENDPEERQRGLGDITQQSSDQLEYQTDKIRQTLTEKLSGFAGVAFTHAP